MDTYNTVRLRLITLCDEKHFSLHKLALSSGIAPLHAQEHPIRKE